MEQYAIQTQSLTKIYGRGFCALNNVCLNIRKGDIFGLVGRNGAGKTTLMRIVAGLALADNGYVSVNGATTYEENEKERRKMGCIVEAPGLYDGLTAQQNMEARALLVNADKSRIRDILATAGLEHARDRKVKIFARHEAASGACAGVAQRAGNTYARRACQRAGPHRHQ